MYFLANPSQRLKFGMKHSCVKKIYLRNTGYIFKAFLKLLCCLEMVSQVSDMADGSIVECILIGFTHQFIQMTS